MKKIPFYFLILTISLSFIIPFIQISAQSTEETIKASGSTNAGVSAGATTGGNVPTASDEYVVLVPLPGIGDGANNGKTTLETYLPNAFNLMVGIAAGLAFIMITWGGIVYATSDALSSKSEGRGYIENAVWGLLLVIGAWVILNTINPQILNFNLILPKADTQKSSVTTGGAGGTSGTGSGGVGCEGPCPYSYTTAGGTVIKYNDCSNCSPSNSFGLEIKNKVVNGVEVKMNTELGNNLKSVKNSLDSGNTFAVTETWPPTVNHKADGQYDGTSVDVRLNNPTVANINSFINTASANGLRVVYEVKDETQRQSLINQGVPAGSIIKVGYITAGHFSVYKK